MARNFKDKVREQFGRTADGYVRNKGFAQGEDLAEAVRLLKPTQDDVMLDVACGGGHTALYFSPYVRSVVAYDLTMQMLKKAQEYISEGDQNVTFRDAEDPFLPRIYHPHLPSPSLTFPAPKIPPVPRPEGRQDYHTLLPEDEEIADFRKSKS
jgi:SAM-dependent methyltransferase